jgi:hypothetical protein
MNHATPYFALIPAAGVGGPPGGPPPKPHN